MAQVPDTFDFKGLVYEPEVNFWNLNANIIGQLNQECLMNRQGHQLNLLKNAIIKHVENEKKPHTNIPLFKICGNESKLLSVRENFNKLLIDEGETDLRSTAYYINKDICVRHWIFGNIPGILQRGIKNFVAYGDVYTHSTNMATHSTNMVL
uniref:Uncharacterized protein n=1 Tax=Meloidogyne javanica TaxID=6303 RepID=A0A915LXE6_MELJA